MLFVYYCWKNNFVLLDRIQRFGTLASDHTCVPHLSNLFDHTILHKNGLGIIVLFRVMGRQLRYHISDPLYLRPTSQFLRISEEILLRGHPLRYRISDPVRYRISDPLRY
jgi:hypothetical protein